MDSSALIDNIISQRRTTKPEFYDQSREIPRGTIEKLLQSACWAPNHGRTEPWRFLVYSGEGRKRLRSIVYEFGKQGLCPEKKVEKWSSNCSLAPLIIGVIMKRTENGKISRDEELMAVSCAVQNLLISAQSHGLCSYWSSGISPLPGAAAALGFDGEEDLPIGFIHLGFAAEDAKEKEGVRRLSVEQLTTFID